MKTNTPLYTLLSHKIGTELPLVGKSTIPRSSKKIQEKPVLPTTFSLANLLTRPSGMINGQGINVPQDNSSFYLPSKKDTVENIKVEYNDESSTGEESTGKGTKECTNESISTKSERMGSTLLKASKKICKEAQMETKAWKEEEDQQILELVQRYGPNWTTISKMLGGERSAKQIRNRYINQIDPNIKKNTKWTTQEDEKLVRLFKLKGRKWRWISKLIPGRSESMVKSRMYSKFKHLLTQMPGKDDKTEMIKQAEKQFMQEETKRLKKMLQDVNPGKIQSLIASKALKPTIPSQYAFNSMISRSKNHSDQMIDESDETRLSKENSNNVPNTMIKEEAVEMTNEQIAVKVEDGGCTSSEREADEKNSPQIQSAGNTALNSIEERVKVLENFLNLGQLTGCHLSLIKEMIQAKRTRGDEEGAFDQYKGKAEAFRSTLPKIELLFVNSLREIQSILDLLAK